MKKGTRPHGGRLTDGLTGGDEPVAGDDSELLHFGGEEHARGGEEQGVDALQGVAGVEALEVHRRGRDHLLSQFQLFAQHLNDCN